jgi:O-antigen ligase
VKPAELILRVLRGGLLAVPWVALLVAGRAGSWWPLTPDLLFPDVTLKAFCFRALVGSMLGLWLVLVCLQPRFRPRRSLATAALAGFVAVLALADLCGHDPQRSIWSSLERMEGLVGWVHLLAFYLIASTVLDRAAWWSRLAVSSVLACLAVSAFALAQWLLVASGGPRVLPLDQMGFVDWLGRLHNPVSEAVYFRADARFGSPVYLAVYMLFHIWIALLLAQRASRRWQRAALWAAAALFAAVMFATQTRIAVVGLLAGAAVAAAVVAAQRGRRWRAAVGLLGALALLAAATAAVVLVAPEWTDRLGLERLRWIGPALERRLLLWGVAVQGLLERPWLGWGQESFGYLFDRYCDPRMWADKAWFDRAHNVFLDWFAAAGAAGGAAYLLLFATPFFYAWSRATPLTRGQRVLWTGLLTSYGIFELVMLDNLVSYLLFLAAIGYLDARRRAAAPAAVGAPANRAVTATAVALALLGAPAAVHAINVPGWRSAAAIQRAIAARGVVRDARGVPRLAIADALAIDSFAKSEAREQAVHLAGELWADPQVPRALATDAVDLALQAMAAERREHPASARTLYLTAALLTSAARPREAIALLCEARALSPRKRLLVHALVDAHLRLGEVERALELARQPHEWAPEDPEAALVLAIVALRAGDAQRPLVESLIDRLHPPGEWTLPDERLARALVAARRFDLLERVLARLAAVGPARLATRAASPAAVAGVHLALARAQADGGDKGRAIATLRRMPQIHPPSTAVAAKMLEELER